MSARHWLLQNLVRPDIRGVTVAVLLVTANIASLAIASQLIGLASDMIAPQIADPAQSLSIALPISGLAGISAAAHFRAPIGALPGNLARAGTA